MQRIARWRVSEHAIDRYQQRVERISVDAIIDRLSVPKVMAAIADTDKSGAVAVVVVENVEVRISAGVVVTVIGKSGRGKQREFDYRRRRTQHWRAALRHQGVI